jgi:peptidoglycan/LPS O-acetylase OafA/YrhL
MGAATLGVAPSRSAVAEPSAAPPYTRTDRADAHSQRQSIPGLDGIRGLAILLVLVFHLRPDVLPGGWIGMSVFFPLSGFLITGLLISAIGRNGRVGLRTFWFRRARRLFPALYVVLATIAVVLVIGGAWTSAHRGATLSSVLYVNNWWQIAHSTDYWAQFGATRSPFEHLWSLSVEEQFYIVWPVLVAVIARWSRRPVRMALITAAFLTVAAGAYGVVIGNLGDKGMTAIYYNTFVRGGELLAGSLLALWLASNRRALTSPTARRVLDLASPVLLLCIVLGAVVLDDTSNQFVADGGMFVAGLVTVVIIAAVVRGARLGAVLGLSPIRWMGTRCYSLYLWHWPIIVLVTTQNSGLRGWNLTLLQSALIVAATVLTFWLVEEPIRRGGSLRAVWNSTV